MNNRVEITFDDLILLLKEAEKQKCAITVDINLALTFTYDKNLKQIRFNYDWRNEISITNIDNIYIWENHNLITIHAEDDDLHLLIHKPRFTVKEYIATLKFLKNENND